MTDVLREIGTISRALDAISNIEFKEIDMTKGQYVYLVRICENPGIIPERLADVIKVDRSTLSRAIKKLELKGFIEKKPDDYNKKIKLLFPTEKGKAAAEFIQRENAYSTNVALQGLSEDEISKLQQLLEKMKLNIEADYEYVKSGHKRQY